MLKNIMNRSLWQFILVVVFLAFAFLHAFDNIYPSAHALCPFGGLVSLYSLFTEGTFVYRTHGSSLFLFLAIVFSAILLGKIFCGWFCPLGTLGEWSRKLGKKLGIKKVEVKGLPEILLRLLKYVLLGLILYFVWSLGELFYKGWCPWSAFMTVFEPDELVEDVLMGGIILVGVLGLSLSIERFFCRYLCPLGAAISIFNRLSFLKPVRNSNCGVCKECEKVCPVGIHIANMEKINDSNCIRCYQCIDKCSKDGALSLNAKSLKSYHAALIAVLVIGITVLFAIQMGYWERGRTLSARGSGQFDQQGISTWQQKVEDEDCDEIVAGSERQPFQTSQDAREQGTIEDLDQELQNITAMKTIAEISEITGLSEVDIYEVWDLPDSFSSEATLREIIEYTGLSRRQLLEKLSAQF